MCVSNKQAPVSCAEYRIWHEEGGGESWLEPSPWIGTANVLGADGLRYGSLSWVGLLPVKATGFKASGWSITSRRWFEVWVKLVVEDPVIVIIIIILIMIKTASRSNKANKTNKNDPV